MARARSPFRRSPGAGCISIAIVGLAVALSAYPAAAQENSSNALPRLEAKYLQSFTGPGNLRWTLPPILEKAVTIIAGAPGPPPEETTMQEPIAVVTDTQNRLLVGDTGSLTVHVLDYGQRRYWNLNLRDSGVQSLGGIAVDSNGVIYVTSPFQGRIFTFSAKGKLLGQLQQRKGDEASYARPIGIAIDDAHGFIYICDRDNNLVLKLDRSGRMLQRTGARGGGGGPGDFRRPTQIVLAGGNLFVLDSGNARIQELDANGRFLAQFPAPDAAALAVDKWNRILVSEPVVHRVAAYRSDGKFLGEFGGTGPDEPAFGRPAGLWIDSGHCLYVADRNKSKVDLYEIGGESASTCLRN